MKTGMVQARIAAFESKAKDQNVKEHHIFSPSKQVSKMISFFETKKNCKKSVNPSSPQVSTKVVKLASIFEPVVGPEDDKKAAMDNFPTTEGTSEVRGGDLKAQFSLVTSNSAQPLSPQLEVEKDLDSSRKVDGYAEIVDNKGTTKPRASKRDRKSRTQEFGMNGDASGATSLGMEPEKVKSKVSYHQSGRKTLEDISAEECAAPLTNGAYRPNGASIRLMESRAVDEIQPNADNSSQPIERNRGKKTTSSEKFRSNEGKNKSRKVRAKNNTKSRASVENIPKTEAKTGQEKVSERARRSGSERNSRIRKMLIRGVRALRRKVSRQTIGKETDETTQDGSQGIIYTVTIESASPITVSCKAQDCL